MNAQPIRAPAAGDGARTAPPPPLTVSELTQQLKTLVEGLFPRVCIEGEISNFSRASSGHLYFTLKDEAAQLRAVMWRSSAQGVRFQLHDGLHVVAAGPIELYAARGQYQMVVEQLAPQGIGALELAFRQLYERLSAEGLFRAQRKRPLPRFPRRIAVVTSPTGAAVRDILQVITRRWPSCDVVILPVAVQGSGAAAEVAAALRDVARIPGVDVVIAGRGGGSLEDLWAFNEEMVARAIHDCPIPVVSAVGHEIDVTIADLVADRRALTPSEAGELVVPQRSELLAELEHLGSRLIQSAGHALRRRRALVDSLSASRALARPLEAVHDRQRRLDELADRLRRTVRQRMELARRELARVGGTIDALSPLKVLGRGYSLTRRAATHGILRSADEVHLGERVETVLARGRLHSIVESIEP
jgi:exodeoxyribonuclease VII large subunit